MTCHCKQRRVAVPALRPHAPGWPRVGDGMVGHADKMRFLLPADEQDQRFFMSNNASVWDMALFIDYEATQFAIPETLFRAYCT